MLWSGIPLDYGCLRDLRRAYVEYDLILGENEMHSGS